MKYELNKRQTAILCSIMFLSLKVLSLPALFYTFSAMHSIFIFATLLLIDLLGLWLVLILKSKNNNFNFTGFLKKCFGKTIANIILLLFLFYFAFKIVFLSFESFYYIKSFAHEEITIVMFVIVFFPIIASLAFNGLKNVARTIEFFFTPVLIGIFATLLIAFLPHFFNSLIPVQFALSGDFSTIYKLSFFGCDFLPILFFLDKIKPEKGLTTKCMTYSFITTIILLLIYFIYYKLYALTASLHQNAVSDIISFTKGLDYTTSVNLISFLTYLITMFLQGAILFLLCERCVCEIANINNKSISIGVVFCLLICIMFIVNRFNVNYDMFIENVMCYFSLLTIIFVPSLLIIQIFKKGRENGKYKKIY